VRVHVVGVELERFLRLDDGVAKALGLGLDLGEALLDNG